MIPFLKKLWGFIYFRGWKAGFWSSPDRKFLEKNILQFYSADPMVQDVLFVGVQDYTQKYEKYFAHKHAYVTIDPDPNLQTYGSTTLHWVAKVQDIAHHCPEARFDLVIMNGVIGFGLDDLLNTEKSIAAIAKVLKPGGHLVLGTNPYLNLNFTLADVKNLTEFFQPERHPKISLAEIEIKLPLSAGASHCYSFFVRTS